MERAPSDACRWLFTPCCVFRASTRNQWMLNEIRQRQGDWAADLILPHTWTPRFNGRWQERKSLKAKKPHRGLKVQVGGFMHTRVHFVLGVTYVLTKSTSQLMAVLVAHIHNSLYTDFTTFYPISFFSDRPWNLPWVVCFYRDVSKWLVNDLAC